MLTLRHYKTVILRMINEIIKDRMEVVGLTQAKLSEAIGCTPTQLSLFLKGEASLNRIALDKCFVILGIPVENISRRIKLAKRTAQTLKSFSIEEVASMSRTDIIKNSNIKEIEAFPVVSREEFELMVSSGVADYESTFQYFKAIVLQFMQMPEKITPKTAETSLNLLAKSLIVLPFIPFVGSIVGMAAAVGALAMKKTFLSNAINNAWGPLLTLTFSLFEKEYSHR